MRPIAAVNSPPAGTVEKRNELFQQAIKLSANEQFPAAIASAEQSLEIQRQIGPETEDACLMLEQIAAWQERCADFAAASTAWDTVQALSAKVRGKDHWHTLADCAMADCARQAAKLPPAAQQQLVKAIKLSMAAEQQFAAGKYGPSHEQAKAALKIRSELLGSDNLMTASSLHDLAAADLGLGDSQAARPLFEKCIAIRQRAMGDANPYTLASLTNLSVVYSILNDTKATGETLERILRGSTTLYGAANPATIGALFELANFYLDQNDLTQAEPALNTVAVLQSKLYHGQHLDLAKTLGRLGTLYLKKSDPGQAEKCYEQSLAMYRRLAGNDNPQTAGALVSLAVLEYSQKKYSRAVGHLQEAIAIYSKAEGADSGDVIDAQHWLARVLPATGEVAQAERLCRRVLAYYEKNLDPNDFRIGQLLLQMGVLYCGWNDIGSAEPCLKRALEISRQTAGAEHPDTLSIAVMLATVDAKSGRLEQAERECRAAVKTLQHVAGANHTQTAAAELALGNIYIFEEKFDQAEAELSRLLAARPNQTVDDRYRNAIVLEKLANVALQRGDYALAATRAQQVTKTYSETLADWHPHQAEALLIGGIANHALHHDAEAKRQADWALGIARRQIDTAAIAQFERQQLALNYRLREILDLQLSLPADPQA
ncbi:MAG TPA: tetratricopeptide repeat protein, partial [Pirellulales bacterium]